MNDDDDHIHDDLKSLANGINFAVASLNNGQPLDFLLILVRPDASGEHVTLNTITGITDPHKVRTIGEHLIDMAKAQQGQALDPESDSDVKGHA